MDRRADGDGRESLEPVSLESRTWRAHSYAALWLNALVTPSSYITGAALLAVGLSWSEALAALSVASCVVLPALILNAQPGTAYGISFPVYCRAAFGVRGAVVVALSRGVIAVFWLSFQLWLGTQAIHRVLLRLVPAAAAAPRLGANLDLLQLGVFLSYVALHAALIWRLRSARLRVLFGVSGPVQAAGLVALLLWSCSVASPVALLAASRNVTAAARAASASASAGRTGSTATLWWQGVTASVSGWSTMVLNIADLSRFAVDQRAQAVGQAVGYPLLNVVVPMSGILATGAAMLTYGPGAASWDLLALFSHWPLAVALPASVVVAAALLSVNLLANVVSPANDLANLAPGRISFRAGAVAGGGRWVPVSRVGLLLGPPVGRAAQARVCAPGRTVRDRCALASAVAGIPWWRGAAHAVDALLLGTGLRDALPRRLQHAHGCAVWRNGPAGTARDGGRSNSRSWCPCVFRLIEQIAAIARVTLLPTAPVTTLNARPPISS